MEFVTEIDIFSESISGLELMGLMGSGYFNVINNVAMNIK